MIYIRRSVPGEVPQRLCDRVDDLPTIVILVPDPHDRDGELTLAVTLDAARAFADPAAVVADARRWSRYVGIVDDDPAAVEPFLAAHGIDNDYALDGRDKRRALAAIEAASYTPRRVLVGASPEDRRLASHVGWEFLTASEAATTAGWRLSGRPADEDPGENGANRTNGGVFGRLRAAVDGRSPWSNG